MRVVGSSTEFGSWNPESAPIMTGDSQGNWSVSVNVPKMRSAEFKFVVTDKSNPAQSPIWETCENRLMNPMTQAVYNCTWSVLGDLPASAASSIVPSKSTSTPLEPKKVAKMAPAAPAKKASKTPAPVAPKKTTTTPPAATTTKTSSIAGKAAKAAKATSSGSGTTAVNTDAPVRRRGFWG